MGVQRTQTLKEKIVKIFWELESSEKGLGKEIFSKTMDEEEELEEDEELGDGEEGDDDDEEDSKDEDGNPKPKKKKKKKKKGRKNSWRSFLNEALFSQIDDEEDELPEEATPAAGEEPRKSVNLDLPPDASP